MMILSHWVFVRYCVFIQELFTWLASSELRNRHVLELKGVYKALTVTLRYENHCARAHSAGVASHTTEINKRWTSEASSLSLDGTGTSWTADHRIGLPWLTVTVTVTDSLLQHELQKSLHPSPVVSLLTESRVIITVTDPSLGLIGWRLQSLRAATEWGTPCDMGLRRRAAPQISERAGPGMY
jgi:hypothetical protein